MGITTSAKKIGIIGAMDDEVDTLKSSLSDTKISTFGWLCCEMEGAAIAQVCYMNSTPFVIIRAISDKADDSEEMSFEEFKKEAGTRCAAIARYIASHC